MFPLQVVFAQLKGPGDVSGSLNAVEMIVSNHPRYYNGTIKYGLSC